MHKSSINVECISSRDFLRAYIQGISARYLSTRVLCAFSQLLAMADSVKLLSFWASRFGMKVHYALNLKGVDYEYKEEDLSNKSEELLQANPIYKKIPALIHNGKVICESSIIVDYIDNAWPDKHKLLPSDPYEKAMARFWADFGDKKIYDAGARIIRTSGEEKAKGVEDMKENIKLLDGALAKLSKGGPFFGGDKMNFADVCLAPFICWFKAYETISDFKLPGVDECPHLHKWVEAVSKEEAVKKSTPSPDKIVEFVPARRKRLGLS